jgi:predicted small integral membrane protein
MSEAVTQSIIITLSLIILNNFLQTEFLFDVVNKVLSLDTKVPLNYEDGTTLENRMYMSLTHSLVLIVLVGLGALSYFVPLTKSVSNMLKK